MKTLRTLGFVALATVCGNAAEFGLGMRLAVDKQHAYASELVRRLAPLIGEDLATALLAAITSDSGKQALNVAVENAIKVGAFGVPYFVVDGEPLWGCDRLWMLEHWLAHGTWEGAGAAMLEKAGK